MNAMYEVLLTDEERAVRDEALDFARSVDPALLRAMDNDEVRYPREYVEETAHERRVKEVSRHVQVESPVPVTRGVGDLGARETAVDAKRLERSERGDDPGRSGRGDEPAARRDKPINQYRKGDDHE